MTETTLPLFQNPNVAFFGYQMQGVYAQHLLKQPDLPVLGSFLMSFSILYVLVFVSCCDSG